MKMVKLDRQLCKGNILEKPLMFLPMSSTRPWTSNERQSCSWSNWTHHFTEFVTFGKKKKKHSLDLWKPTYTCLLAIIKQNEKQKHDQTLSAIRVHDVNELSGGAELTIHETSGLFDHHVWCVVQWGISLPGKRGGSKGEWSQQHKNLRLTGASYSPSGRCCSGRFSWLRSPSSAEFSRLVAE